MGDYFKTFKVGAVLAPLSRFAIGCQDTKADVGLQLRAIEYDGGNKPIEGTIQVDLYLTREMAGDLMAALQKGLGEELNPPVKH